LKPPDANSEETRPHRRKWKRWVAGGLLVLLIGGVLWLNGPGLRWLAPKLAQKYLSDAGLEGSFELEGSLTGGLKVKDLKLEGDGVVAKLDVGTVTPDYRLNELRKGKIRGIDVDGLHAELRFGVDTEQPDEKKEPLDLEKLVQTLRSVRGTLVPLNVDVRDVTLDVSYQDEPLISLDESQIHHEAGEDEFELELGALTDAAGREWPARDSTLVWNEDSLSLDRLDPLPGIGFRDLVVGLPETGGPSLETELHVEDAVFGVDASKGFTSVQVNLREGRLESEELARRFNFDLPASGELSSLSLDIDNLLPNPKDATGSARVLFENIIYQDWTVPELNLDATLDEGSGTLAARGRALDSEFGINAEAGIGRQDGGFRLSDVRGTFNVAEVSKVVPALSGRYEAINPEAAVPTSTVDGDFHVGFADKQPESAEVNLTISPAEPETATPLDLTIGWKSDQTASMRLAMDGVKGSADFNIEEAGYDARMEFEGFRSAAITPWLQIAKLGDTGEISLTGVWRGRGDLDANTHQGSVDLASAEVVREGMPAIHAEGRVSYDWPGSFTTENLLVKADEQTISADLKLADGMLEVDDLLWKDGETEMATGNAKLPVPEDFSKWRETLAEDERPIAVSLESKVLPLERLKEWLPGAEKLDEGSTGKIDINITGTYADPDVNAELALKDLKSPEQPDLPPTDLNLSLIARDGRASVQGTATAPDIPPANISATMPFRPAEWAENPELIKSADISGRVDLPRIDISRFSSLIPGAESLTGTVSGHIELGGELGKPLAKGNLDLVDAGLEMENPDIPAISGLSSSIDLGTDRITLNNLKTTVAGGTLTGGGSVALENGKPGFMDIRLRGDHLPLRRDESLILRANADLRLTGTMEQATLSGTLGVVDSLFFRDIELIPIGSPFTVPSAAELPKIDTAREPTDVVPERFRDWALDVTLRTEDPFLIRGNLATGQITGSVRVRGTLGDPAPDGKVTISDFKASLPFSTLTVRSGSAIFTPETGFDPLLEIRGTAEPRPYRVNAYVYGNASDPQLMLTSSPPLPENEIMTLLATGTTTSGLEDPQAASSRALQLFIEELRRGRFGFGKRLRPLLAALDRVDFTLAEEDPYSNETFTTATIKLTDRWYLTAGMGEEGNSRVLAMWRLRFY
jgi:hypothetical protein